MACKGQPWVISVRTRATTFVATLSRWNGVSAVAAKVRRQVVRR